jgi:signal transduction histidine kinase
VPGAVDIPQYDSEALADLSEARLRFLERGEVDEAVRPVVRDSWLRSKAQQVDPRRLVPQHPDAQRLARLLEANRRLVGAANPVLDEMRAALAGSPHVIALADAQGSILKLGADPQVGTETNMFAGASWREEAIGCNGVGTALEAREAVILIGPEHLQDTYIGWTCIGMPLRGEDGQVVGVLDLSVPNETVNVHTWGWALSAGRAIEARHWAALPEEAGTPIVPPVGADPFQTIRGVLTLLGSRGGMPSHRALLSDGLQHLEGARAQVDDAARELEVIRRGVEDDHGSARVMASLGHELRNPLWAITAAMDLLEQESWHEGEAGHALAVIRRQVKVLLRLADDISDAVRAKGGHITLQTRRLDVRWVAVRAAETVRARVAARRQTLVCTGAPAPLWVMGDDVRLEQALVNLLVNASKYTQPGGRIQLRCDEVDGEVLLSVADDGQGIAREDLPRIFEPFHRSEKTTGGDGVELGLGLALVRTFVELHGGSVTADSPGRSRGSTFRVRLPLAGHAIDGPDPVSSTG